MYTEDRNAYRQLFFDVWAKYSKKLPLQPVEAQVLDVILTHPEYHSFLDQPKQYLSQEFTMEENPFIHMSLHIAVREQLQLDRPAGIKSVYQNLLTKHLTEQEAEHAITTILAKVMFDAQQTGNMVSEEVYLEMLKELE